MYNFPYMRTFLIIIVILFVSYAKAQEKPIIDILLPLERMTNEYDIVSTRQIEKSTTFAIGNINRLDTYLSQEEYNGTEFRFISDLYKIRLDRWDLNFTHEGAIDYTHNRVDNANTLAGHYDFAFSMLKAIEHRNKYSFHAGFMTDLYTGFAYNMRNTANNPAQGYASLSIGGAIKAHYDLLIRHKILKINYEARLPFVGIMFSPAYGQSYYELFNNGNYDNNIVVTSIAIPQYRHQLSIDYPINNQTYIRIGYLGDYRQSKPNELKQHTYTNSFLIGFVLRK